MTFQYNFDKISNRWESDSLKWKVYGEDILPMWVADMDFVSPEPVISALHARLDHGIFGYPESAMDKPMTSSGLRHTIQERMFRLYQWEIEPEDIILIPGVVTGFNLACHALVNPEQAVLIQTPVYPPILNAAKETGILKQEMELTRCDDGAYAVDWDLFESCCTPFTRIFILCNPHNPIGKVFKVEELQHIAQICLQKGVIICSDEIHCDLVYRGYKHTPIATLDPEVAQNTITLMAPSKTYNIPGLQCSFAIIQNPELRKIYLEARKGLVPWVNLLGVVAADAAYQHGQDWLNQLLIYLERNRDYLYQNIQEKFADIEMGLPEATYLAWLDCRKLGISENPYKFFLKNGHVALNDGTSFGRGGEGFVRLNFGCPKSLLIDGLERLKTVLSSCRS